MRLRERLPRLQRHLGGLQYWKTAAIRLLYALHSDTERKIFVGGKFRDTRVNHENNEN